MAVITSARTIRFGPQLPAFAGSSSFGSLERRSTHITLTNLGSVQQELGELAGARATLQRALAINEAAYGPDHPHVAQTLRNLRSVQEQMET